MATLCHSVRSLRSPDCRSFHVSEVAMLKFATLPPFWNDRTSGSAPRCPIKITLRSEEHTSELQSLMRISYAVFCLKKKNRILLIIIYYTNINKDNIKILVKLFNHIQKKQSINSTLTRLTLHITIRTPTP